MSGLISVAAPVGSIGAVGRTAVTWPLPCSLLLLVLMLLAPDCSLPPVGARARTGAGVNGATRVTGLVTWCFFFRGTFFFRTTCTVPPT